MSLLSMPMVDYNPDDTCAELVLLQGISAQLTRIKRRHRSLCAFPTTATATETTTSNTPKSQSLIAQFNAVALIIIIRFFFTTTIIITVVVFVEQKTIYTAGGMLATPPDSPMCASKRTSSINPRFSDAHFEYIGDDCVIHNGMQTIDIALEFATQRAAPRLVNFSKSPSTAQQLPITP
ncbi:hypothetical protein GGI12_000205 [Dipsacomyces acuminosporus]|nr:hypothetical protein GGI12_000205 [Dipsacomyces acuminosporus]